VPAGFLIRGICSDAIFPDVELERKEEEKITIYRLLVEPEEQQLFDCILLFYTSSFFLRRIYKRGSSMCAMCLEQSGSKCHSQSRLKEGLDYHLCKLFIFPTIKASQ